ncbi:MAG: hypothetical protein J7L88_05420 [Thermoplasmata archaeon]|nr:hypothetical protein [Thermoplasmata archaeon]
MQRIEEEIKKALDEEDALREEAYRLHREAIRAARDAIKRVSNGGELGEEIYHFRDSLLKILEENPVMHRYTFIEDALTEIAEALIFSAVMSGEDLPTPGEISIHPRLYLLGLADAVGEMRRVVISMLIEGDIEGAGEMLKRMEEAAGLVDAFVYPSSLIALKRKQDVVRSLLDRTKGEYLIAVSSAGYGRRFVSSEQAEAHDEGGESFE